jgi:hypothetical protein
LFFHDLGFYSPNTHPPSCSILHGVAPKLSAQVSIS